MNGNNTQCFLAQFYNAIYVLDGDSSNPNAVHIFNPNSKTWSIQSISGPDHFDITSAGVILDHDTNVFCEWIFFSFVLLANLRGLSMGESGNLSLA